MSGFRFIFCVRQIDNARTFVTAHYYNCLSQGKLIKLLF